MGKFPSSIFGVSDGASSCTIVLLWGTNARMECGAAKSSLKIGTQMLKAMTDRIGKLLSHPTKQSGLLGTTTPSTVYRFDS